jgi:prophage maintenance system killer protein
VASLVSLSLNDVEIKADEEEFERIVLGVAGGNIAKASVAEFFRNNSSS